MTNPYLTYFSPNTGCSCSFSSAHLATWEGEEKEDDNNVINVVLKLWLVHPTNSQNPKDTKNTDKKQQILTNPPLFWLMT